MFNALRLFKNHATTLALFTPLKIQPRSVYPTSYKTFQFGQRAEITENNRKIFLVQDLKKDQDHNENYQEYRKRSIREFCASVPVDLKNRQEVLVIHLLQTVFHPSQTDPNKIVLYSGHIMAFLAKFDTEDFTIIPGSVISKRPSKNYRSSMISDTATLSDGAVLSHASIESEAYFDTETEVYDDKFVQPRASYEQLGSNNFIRVVDLAVTSLKTGDFQDNIAKIKQENKGYQLMNSACSQAFMEACGLSASSQMSTQRALQSSMVIIKNENTRKETLELLETLGATTHPIGLMRKHIPSRNPKPF